MSPPSIHLIEDLSTKDMEKLTEVLRLPPGRFPTQDWLEDQASRVTELPSRLLKPNTTLLRLGMSLNLGPDRALLCRSHRNLDPYLIRRIFLQVSAECTTRLARLVQNPYISTDIDCHVKRLQILNSLWMSVDLFRVTFQVTPEDPRFFRVPGDCEACILATVGGNPHTLCDLRASMLGRKKKQGKEPRMLKLAEAWIKWTGFGPQLTAKSDELAREVRACRRGMQLARRQKRRNQIEGIPEESPSLFSGATTSDDSTLVVDEGDDIVSEIINHYAGSIRSCTPLLRRPAREDDIHPAYGRATIPPQPRISDTTPPSTPQPALSTSTSYASITTNRPDRLSTENLQRLNDQPPGPERPRYRSAYMDSMTRARMSRESVVIPPLRPRHEPAYTGSAYSRDIFGRKAGDAGSFATGGATMNNVGLAAQVQARSYTDLMRRQYEFFMVDNPQNMFVNHKEDVDMPPIPKRSEHRAAAWSDFAENRAPRPSWRDGW